MFRAVSIEGPDNSCRSQGSTRLIPRTDFINGRRVGIRKRRRVDYGVDTKFER